MKYKKIMAISAGLFSIFVALVIVEQLAVEAKPNVVKEPVKQPVSTVTVVAKAHHPEVTLIGNTRARFLTQLKVTSDGQLDWLDTHLEPGNLIKKQTLLAKLDMTHLKSELAEAKSRVEHAKLELERQLHEQSVALSMLSPNNQSPFAKREPQVAAAKSDLTQAEQALKSTEKRVHEAKVSAPFDAVILSRFVSPNDWLSAGEALFEVAASDSIDVVVPVSEPVWQMLQGKLKDKKITMHVTDRANKRWPASLRYIAPNLDVTTRQRRVVLQVTNPYEQPAPLLPNQPVQVSMAFSEPVLSYQVPQSAVTRDGYIWTLGIDNTLQKEAIEVLSKSSDAVHIRFEKSSENAKQVVVYPLLSMIAGTHVEPISQDMQLADNTGAGEVSDELAH
ncbi:efflux RND transporter periplasmic adaptor subunit [Pseudoalteromonas luteoviolacea]|uniref:efflux RND transporter periplasmic adaptor subunit n=1 Tax=Pseudoalteromonas luteoviolacea TaxID=43657 RepID=UPI001B3A5EDE|nr:efflux RND transporter periplasmic adaptor subunit [Pseudoalteromonas luteoviolacea]MBQ4876617.1 efflux RND transporter periplasmic adaptor subunit [Pseudoalteromonas luteoviolacea]MBQ4905248.1 efflux RND transporter periplasmic adaptor subunit [Pseudoalteromonas luteoviolacea]